MTKNIIQTRCVSNRTNQNFQVEIRMCTLEFHLDIICIIFINLKDNQLFRFCTGDLTTKLTANGTAATGNHDHLTGNISEYFIKIYFNWVTAKKILCINFTKFAYTDFLIYELIHTRNRLNLTVGLCTYAKYILTSLCAGRRDCINNFIYAVFLYRIWDIVSIAYDRDAAKSFSFFDGIIINYAYNMIADIRTIIEFSYQSTTSITCTDNHNIILSFFIFTHMAQLCAECSSKTIRKTNCSCQKKTKNKTDRIK